MEEVGGTIVGHRAPTQLCNILRATFILREICHNGEPARCVPPVVGSFPRPPGHPVKHGDVRALSYLGRRRFALGRRREGKDLEREPSEPNAAPKWRARVRSGRLRDRVGSHSMPTFCCHASYNRPKASLDALKLSKKEKKKLPFCFLVLLKVDFKETFHRFAVWIKAVKLLVLKVLSSSCEHTNGTMAPLDRVQTPAFCCLPILFSPAPPAMTDTTCWL